MMMERRPATAATLATLLLYALTYAHGIVDASVGFINDALSNPSKFAISTSKSSCHTMKTLQRTPSGFHASSLLPSKTGSPWSTQQSNRISRRAASTGPVMMAAQQTVPSSSGFWARPGKQEVSVLQLPLLQHPDVAVVWFTACDLRTHDHDALVAAAGAAGAVPLYVFDDQVRGSSSIAWKLQLIVCHVSCILCCAELRELSPKYCSYTAAQPPRSCTCVPGYSDFITNFQGRQP